MSPDSILQTISEIEPLQTRFLNLDDAIRGLPNHRVADFWRWAYSDVLSNRNRAIFAEYIVGVALGAVSQPRVEWDAVDLRYGEFQIEVKSAADCQSWHQDRPSSIRFSIRKAVVWRPETGKYQGEPARPADAYVFCHYPERNKVQADVLNVPAWDFYVISTRELNARFGEAKSLSLAALKRATSRCNFSELRVAVESVLVR